MRPKGVLSDPALIGVGTGPFTVTGSLNLYFENKTHYEKLINHTSSSLQFTLVDGAGNSLDFTILDLQYSDGNPDASGPNVDIPISLGFTGQKESASGKTIRIDRNPV